MNARARPGMKYRRGEGPLRNGNLDLHEQHFIVLFSRFQDSLDVQGAPYILSTIYPYRLQYQEIMVAGALFNPIRP